MICCSQIFIVQLFLPGTVWVQLVHMYLELRFLQIKEIYLENKTTNLLNTIENTFMYCIICSGHSGFKMLLLLLIYTFIIFIQMTLFLRNAQQLFVTKENFPNTSVFCTILTFACFWSNKSLSQMVIASTFSCRTGSSNSVISISLKPNPSCNSKLRACSEITWWLIVLEVQYILLLATMRQSVWFTFISATITMKEHLR